MNPPCALTIAGSDSGGGAGIQADLKTFTALDVYGASVITALTAQNTTGVQDVHVAPLSVIESQMDSVFSDIRFSSVKTGMLPSEEIIGLTAQKLKEFNVDNVVVDPVLVATSGDCLVSDGGAVQAIIANLFPISTLVTPNIPEAEQITGLSIQSTDDMRKACGELVRLGCNNVLLKGGHLEDSVAADVLFNGKDFNVFAEERIITENTHGTGCTLASAISAELAKGTELRAAVALAKRFVHAGIRSGLDIGKGRGPLNHMHAINSFR